MSDEQTLTTSRRKRGKGFATVPLGEAIRAVKDAGKYGRDHGLNDFAGYLGHTTTNSGPFRQKMAALKGWGLIERNGDRVTFTDLANEIAHPLSTEQEAERIREAFRNEPLFASIYDESTKDTELDLEFIGGRAVNGFGVAPQSKRQFAQSFGESVEAADLGTLDGNGKVRLRALDASNGDASGDDPDDGRTAEIMGHEPKGGLTADRKGKSSPPGLSPVLHQEWTINGGSVVFDVQLDRPLPASAFQNVTPVIEKIEALVKSLEPKAAAGSAPE
ncbi:MAG: hypothetical protein ABR992_08195 [Solirubrobacteraceae bacterium]|jgi:hypothetical protein